MAKLSKWFAARLKGHDAALAAPQAESLERRVLFSADLPWVNLAPDGANLGAYEQTLSAPLSSSSAVPHASQESAPAQSIAGAHVVLVDASFVAATSDRAQRELVQLFEEAALELMIVPADADGLQQLSTLAASAAPQSIQVLTTADADGVQLGDTRLSTRVLLNNAPVLADWRGVLGEDASVSLRALGAEAFTGGGNFSYVFEQLTGTPLSLENYVDAQSLYVPRNEEKVAEASVTSDGARELVFVDTDVDGYEAFLADIRAASTDERALEVVLLNGDDDGVELISATLAAAGEVSAVHIISHGEPGSLDLGGTTLDLATLTDARAQVAGWASFLTDSADILLYGCDVAGNAEGEMLVQQLAALSGADVAASTDKTGHNSLGGDWDFEYVHGDVDAELALSTQVRAAYEGLLDLSAGLVAHWTFDTDASDSSGGGLNGTLQGNAFIDGTDATDRVGAAKLSLDGAGDYVDLSTHAATFSALSEGSISAWVRTTDTGEGVIFGVSDQSDALDLTKFGIENGQLKWLNINDSGGNTIAYSDAVVNDGNWHHVALTVDATGHTLYIDGAVASVSYVAGSASDSTFFNDLVGADTVEIGRSVRNATPEYDYQGQIDAVRVYDRALSATEIAELALENSGGPSASLVVMDYEAALSTQSPVLQLRLDETSGLTAVDSAGSSDGTYEGGVVLGTAGALETNPATAASFNNAQHVEVPHSPDLLVDEGTFQLWFRTADASQTGALFSKDANGFVDGGHVTALLTGNGELEVRLQSNGSSYTVRTDSGTQPIAENEWQHFAFSFGSDGMKLYLNGELLDTDAYTGGLGSSSGGTGNTETLVIGANNRISTTGTTDNLLDFYQGDIDEFVLLGTQVADSDIQALYQAGYSAVQVAEDTSQIFSSANGNALIVSDGIVATNEVLQVTLTVDNGYLSLAQLTGLTLLDGAQNSPFIVASGTEAELNAALDGLVFTPDAGYNGPASLSITTAAANGLVGHYTFEDGTGADQSQGLTADAALLGGAATATDGVRGEVLSLDGVAGSAAIEGVFEEPASATLAAWANLDAGADYGEVISLGNSLLLRLDDPSTGLSIYYYEGGGSWQAVGDSQISLAGAGWNHVAATFDEGTSTATVYLNGDVVATAATSGSIVYGDDANVSQITTIGTHGNGATGFEFDGLIDDARIYTRALDASEIASLAADRSSSTTVVSLSVNAINDAPTFSVGDGIVTDHASSVADYAADLLLQGDGRMIVVGSLNNGAGSQIALTRYLPDGSLDPSFDGDGRVTLSINASEQVTAAALQPDGKILVAGASENGTGVSSIVRFNADGSLDTTFDGDGIFTIDFNPSSSDRFTDITVLPTGEIVAVGYANTATDEQLTVVRLNADGTLDGSFNATGQLMLDLAAGDDSAAAVTVQPDGRILIAGQLGSFGAADASVIRLNTDGSLDTTFNGSGFIALDINGEFDGASAIALDDSGRIVVAGTSRVDAASSESVVYRLTANGTLDNTFNSVGYRVVSAGAPFEAVNALVIQDDGRILLAGDAYTAATLNDLSIIRLNDNGSLDTSFAGDGTLRHTLTTQTDSVSGMVVDRSGNIVVTGRTDEATNGVHLVRFDSAGNLDNTTTFSVANTLDGNPTFVEGGAAVVLDSDVRVFDEELSALDDFNGATLLLERNGGASVEDGFSASGTLGALTPGSNTLIVDGITIGSVTTNSGGRLLLTFNGNATNGLVNAAMQQLAYSNSSHDPPGTVQIDWLFGDGNAGSQGSGSDRAAMGSTIVGITAVNDAPVARDDLLSGASLLSSDPATVGFWRLGESAGATAVDDTGSNNGSYSNVTLGAADPFGGSSAASFNGVDSHVDLGTFDVAGTGLTMTGWIYVEDFGNGEGRLISKADGTARANHSWMLGMVQSGDDYRLRMRLGAGGSVVDLTASAGNLQLGQWYHAAATYDAMSGEMAVYLDGVLVGSLTHPQGGAVDQDPTQSVWIGDNPVGDRQFNGRIDEVAVLDRALTQAEVQTLSYTGPEAYEVAEDQTLVVAAASGVLANDADPEGDPFTAALVSGPSNASSFTLNADGSFNYTPTANWNGTDTFSYRADDGSAQSAVATVTIIVGAVNDEPAFLNLDGSPTFVEGGPAVVLDGDATFFDTDINRGEDNYDTVNLVLQRTGGANPEDTFSATGSLVFQGNNDVDLAGVAVGTLISNAGGLLNLEFNASATEAQVNEVLQALAYSNSSLLPPSSVTISWSMEDANGGAQGSGANAFATGATTVAITPVNSPPVLTSGPGGGTHYEGAGSGTYFNASLLIGDADSSDLDGGQMTVVISSNGEAEDQLLVRAGNGVGVSGADLTYDSGSGPVAIGTWSGGAGTTPLVVTFNGNATVAAAEAVGQQVAYRTLSDTPLAVQRSLEMTLTDGDGATSNTAVRSMNVVATNDAPQFTQPNPVANGTFDAGLTGWDTEGAVEVNFGRLVFGGGNAVGPHSASQTIATVAGSTYELSFDYRDGASFANQSLQVTVDGVSNLLTTPQIVTDIDGSGSERYSYTFTADSDSATITFTDTSDTSGLTTGGTFGVDGAIDRVAVSFVSGTMAEVAYSEDGPAVPLDVFVGATDPELSDGDDFGGATLTVQRQSGADPDDEFSATGALVFDAGTLELASTAIGTYTNAGGTLAITFAGGTSNAQVNEVLQSIAYSNGNDNPPASVLIEWRLNDGNSGAQGVGAAAEAQGSTLVRITAADDAPLLTATGNDPTFTEGGATADLFSAVAVDAIDTGQTMEALELTVSTLADGSSERLWIDGSEVVLVDAASGTTADNGYGYSVSVAGAMATVTVTTPGASAGAMESLVAGMGYFNAAEAPSAGNRVVTLTRLQDSGVGANDSNPAVASTVTVVAVNDAPTGADNTVSTAEDTDYTFTAADFGFSDVDGDVLTRVQITSLENAGSLRLSGVDVAVNQVISVADIDAGRLVFSPAANANGAAYDSFGFAVNDGVTNSVSVYTMTVDVTAVNDAPVFSTLNLTIEEGGRVVLGPANINTLDVDNTPAELTYSFTSLSGGQFEYVADPGVAITSFSQGEINSGQVRFVHDGGENAPTFQMTASDGPLNSATYGPLVTFTNVNDAPVLDATPILSLNPVLEDAGPPVGAVGTLVSSLVDFAAPGGGNDNVTDVDSSVTGIAVTQASSGLGNWYYSTDNGASWNTIPAVSDANALLLQADGATRLYFEPRQDQSGTVVNPLSFRAWDQSTGAAGTLADARVNGGTSAFSSTAEFVSVPVTPVNDAPIIAALALTITEGGAVVPTSGDLAGVDPDNVVSELTYTVSALSAGQFEYLANPGIAIGTFTQADIDAGLVRFVHDGGEAAPTFQLTLSDGILNSGAQAAAITFTNVNDAPVGGDGTITVSEDTDHVFSVADFGFTDVDGHSLLSVVVSTLPASGTLYVDSNGDGRVASGEALEAGDRVMAADVAAGAFKFKPPADVFGTALASFDFLLQDDGGNAAGGSDTGVQGNTLTFDVLPVNDAPQLLLNAGGTVAEGGTLTITPALLQVVDVDHAPSALTFTLTALPAHGVLTLDAQPLQAGSTFSQADIDAGLLTYRHDDSESLADELQFRLNDSSGAELTGAFALTVTPINEAPLARDDSLATTEDTPLRIDVAQLLANDSDPEQRAMTLVVVSQPSHGIVIDNRDGSLSYLPDADYSGPDAFSYRVNDDSGNSAVAMAAVMVDAVNDAPVVLSSNRFVTAEGAQAVGAISTSDVEGDALAFGLGAAADSALFQIDPDTGVVSFVRPMDYEQPADADADNSFALMVLVTDAQGGDHSTAADRRAAERQ